MTSAEPPHKLLQIVTRLNIGGPATHTLLLQRELGSFGYQTTLVAGACEAADGDMSYLLESKDNVTWIPEMSRSVGPWNNFRALVRLWRLIRSVRPDVVHTHTAMAGCLGRAAAFLAGTPVIVHTFHGNSLRGYFSPLANGVFLGIERLLARAADTICVLSGQQLRELSDDLAVAPQSKFRVIPLGLDLSPFTALPPPRLEGGPLRVGWFGRLVPVKNVPLLLGVVRATVEKTDQVEFHVAGDGPEQDSVLDAARRYGPRFVWHGWQRDVTPVINDCHVLLQTSLNEGTPVALIQGMAAARPFLSTAAGGVVDMVTGSELSKSKGCAWYSNGILVDPNPTSFAHALAELSRDPVRLVEMGGHARIFAAKQYNKETMLASLDSLYRALLATKLPQDRRADTRPVVSV